MGTYLPAHLGFRRACSLAVLPPTISSPGPHTGISGLGFLLFRTPFRECKPDLVGLALGGCGNGVQAGWGETGQWPGDHQEGAPASVRLANFSDPSRPNDAGWTNALCPPKVEEGTGVRGQGWGEWLRGAAQRRQAGGDTGQCRDRKHPPPGGERWAAGRIPGAVGGSPMQSLGKGVAEELDLLPANSLTLWSPGA